MTGTLHFVDDKTCPQYGAVLVSDGEGEWCPAPMSECDWTA